MKKKRLLMSLAAAAVLIPSITSAHIMFKKVEANGSEVFPTSQIDRPTALKAMRLPLRSRATEAEAPAANETYGQRLVRMYKEKGWALPYPEERMLKFRRAKAPIEIVVTPPEEPLYFSGFLQYSCVDGEIYTPYGLYKFNTADGLKREALADVDWCIHLGGEYYNDKLHGFSMIPIPDDGGNGRTYYAEWDADTFEPIEGRHGLDLWSNTDIMDPDMEGFKDVAYNPVDGMCYGIKHGDFFKFNYETNECVYINSVEQNVAAIAINSKGEAFFTDSESNLYNVDLTTGEPTLVGPLGFNTANLLQSMTFDLTTDRLYYAASIGFSSDPVEPEPDTFYGGLLEIDTKTGQATLRGLFPEEEEYNVLRVINRPKSGAPADVNDLSVAYNGSSNDGTISFTMPNTTFGGSPMSGEVSYDIYINYDKECILSGNAKPGEKVETSFTAPAEGRNKVLVLLSNEAGQGSRNAVESWAGNDLPLAENVVFSYDKASLKANLSWSVAARKNGYLDIDHVSYNIVRYPDEVTVAENTTETTFSEVIADVPFGGYYYLVTPMVGEQLGVGAKSNSIQIGNALTIPYKDDFESTDAANKYLTIDANGDGYTWCINDPFIFEGVMAYNNMNDNDADDWVLTPPLHMEEDYIFTLDFAVGGITESIPEYLSVYVGEGDNPLQFKEILTETKVPGTAYMPEPMSINFDVEKTGDYRIAFHCTSPGTSQCLFVDDLSITRGVNRLTPAKVDNIKLTPAEEGELEVNIEFDAPTTNNIGEALDKITKIEILRSEKMELVDIIENPTPGSHISLVDEDAVNGNLPYYISAYNEIGQGAISETYVYVGIDAPGMPENIMVYDNLDGTATIEWDAPSVGLHGGYVEPEDIVYDIYMQGEYMTERIAEDVDGTSYEVEIPEGGMQQLLFYGVVSKSELGQSDPAAAPGFLIGDPYGMPYTEGFVLGALNGLWISNQIEGYDAEAAIFNGETLDYDNNLAGGVAVNAPSWASLTSGKIYIADGKNPTLVFSRMTLPETDNTLKVMIRKDGGKDIDTILTFNDKDSNEPQDWEIVKYDLSKYVDAEYIQVIFRFEINDMSYPYVLIDDVNIRDMERDDLSISFEAPKHATVGTPVSMDYTVFNVGDNDADAYTVNIYVDDKLVASQEVSEMLGSFRRTKGSFTYTPTFKNSENSEVLAEIVYNKDNNESNNESPVASMSVVPTLYNTPVDLTAEASDKDVELTWSAPATENTVTESFEGYNTFATEGFGEWKTADEDGSETATITGINYPHSGEPMAFMTFDFSALGIDLDVNPLYKGHSGSQVAFSMMSYSRNDDWLISPELSGDEQTVTFFVRALSGYEGNEFEVHYSTIGNEVKDFTEAIFSGETEYKNEEWMEVSVILPAGAKYFAIRNRGDYAGMFMVDDITYTGKPLTLNGYNVYRDAELIGNTAADVTSFPVEATDGQHVYNVTAVYAEGESGFSNGVTVDASGVMEIGADSTIDGNTYDLSGRRMPTDRKLEKGVYIRNHRKVIVK